MSEWIGILKDILGSMLQPVKSWLLKPEQREHDKKVFLAGDEILNERNLRDYLDETASLHAYRAGFLSKAEKLRRFFEQTSNHYLDAAINKKVEAFIKNLDGCTNFFAGKFEPAKQSIEITDDNFRFIAYTKLHSHLGVGNPEFDEFVKNLESCLDEVAKTYDEYRRLVKQKLII